ncbi:MAG: hypothetical protein ABFD64_11920 [Armatimonadota bacterium]
MEIVSAISRQQSVSETRRRGFDGYCKWKPCFGLLAAEAFTAGVENPILRERKFVLHTMWSHWTTWRSTSYY